jgi:flagellar M-ring protein FliF
VRVINAPFHVEKAPTAQAQPLWEQPWAQDLLRRGAMPAALVLVALVVVFALVRPALKAALAPPPVGARLDEVVEGDAGLPAPGSLPALEAPRSNDKLDAARRMAKDNPAAVANIVRGWVNGEVA